MKKGEVLYYARIVPNILYEVLEIKVRMIENNWFSGVEKRTKQVYMFSKNQIDDIVFASRNDALEKVRASENDFECKNISKG